MIPNFKYTSCKVPTEQEVNDAYLDAASYIFSGGSFQEYLRLMDRAAHLRELYQK